MPRGKGYGSKHSAHSRQFGPNRGRKMARTGSRKGKDAKAMQMKDASNGKQRHFTRSSDNPKTPKR